MLEVNSQDFEEKVLKSDVPVIVDFWASWCAPCKTFAPTFERVSKEFEGKMAFAKCNIDQNADLPQKYDVRGIPCMIIFKGGKESDRLVGALHEGTFKEKINSALK